MVTTLYDLAKLVLLLALIYPPIKIVYGPKRTNRGYMLSRSEQNVVMAKIKVIKADNYGKVHVHQLNVTLVCILDILSR